MKKLVLIVSLLIMAIGVSFGQKSNAKSKIKIEKTDKFGPAKFCPDLAIKNIHFMVLERTAPLTGRIRIQVVIENRGGMDFKSDPGQVYVELYEDYPGTEPILLKRKKLSNLPSGDRVKAVRLRKNWLGPDFPPVYKAKIVFDPSVRTDGNKFNDDCNKKNNKKERSGEWFNEKLR